MITVGITGGIGSGKSTVSNIFIKLGIPVFFSDIEAAKLISRNKKISRKIISEFGDEIHSRGIIDRKKLAETVFSEKKKLAKLNAIIHPAVREQFKKWTATKKNFKYVIQEAAILIETGSYKNLDYTVLVTAPEELRIARVKKRDKISREKILQRVSNQLPDTEKKKHADFIIVNDDRKLTFPQVLKIHNFLLKNKNVSQRRSVRKEKR